MGRRTKMTYLMKVRVVFLLLVLAFILAAMGFFLLVVSDIPAIDMLRDYRPNVSTRVYADNNDLVDEFFLEDRKLLPFEEIPRVLKDAFIAAEDADFYEHGGLDFWGISRALFKNVMAGRIVQGGSTITQQVAKAMYLTPERSLLRKLREAILAVRIDRYLTKDQILGLYLNQIYLGHGAYGVEAASLVYFGKGVGGLTLAEASLLAGLPKAPSLYSPYNSLERAKQRQQYVLERMLEEGKITAGERDAAMREPINLKSVRPKDKLAPYFIEHVRRYIAEKYGYYALYREGLEIYTTLDAEMQKAANAAVANGIKTLEDSGREEYKGKTLQAALLCLDAKTGAIRAMVGGRDFSNSEFNRAVQSQRQPGSAFKPFVYSAAFDKGYTPATTVDDEPVSYSDPSIPGGTWRPKNYDGKFLGRTTLRSGLVHSRNIVTIKLLEAIGPGYVVAFARNLGIESPMSPTLSLALGSYTVTLQELVRAYGVFANAGKRVKPFFIRRIVDRKGTVFEENIPEAESVLDPKIAYITTHVMKGVIQSGTGARARAIGRPAAGKTGTTNDMRDAWFIGFTPHLVAGVWVGFDDNGRLYKSDVGGVAAAPIWLAFMSASHRGIAPEDFPVPRGVLFHNLVYEFSGGSARQTIREAFLEGDGVPDASRIGLGEAAQSED